jgi:hypothetical protein
MDVLILEGELGPELRAASATEKATVRSVL